MSRLKVDDDYHLDKSCFKGKNGFAVNCIKQIVYKTKKRMYIITKYKSNYNNESIEE